LPPVPTSVLVAIADSDRVVSPVIALATARMSSARQIPESPTTKPARMNMITPRMVSTLGVNTPVNVPNRPAFVGCGSGTGSAGSYTARDDPGAIDNP
jgi:hypothetical protein